MKIAVFGLGYWGPNLVRNFLAHPEVDNVVAVDLSEEHLHRAAARFRGIEISDDPEGVFEREDVIGVAIATPVNTHYPLTRAALEAGKHVMVAKPFVTEMDQVDELIRLADEKQLRLMVDHTYLFTPAVRKIKQLTDEGQLGRVLYIDSVRANLGLFQSDANVIWDLAPHDISILRYLIDERPKSVSATGMRHFYDQENIAYVSVMYEEMMAHFCLNWVSPVKVRCLSIGGTERMIQFDDLQADEKIRIYDKGVAVQSSEQAKRKLLVEYRTGDILAPKLESKEALLASTGHFLECIRTGERPLSDGRFARDVVEILVAADQSLRAGGATVALPGAGARAAVTAA